MLELQVETNADEVAGWFRELYRDQLPFAIAKAINATAIDFQKRQQAGMRARFTIRRDWTLRGIKINREDFANKQKLEAIVHVESDRGFLLKFETGGIDRPIRARSITVPVDVDRTKTGLVSGRLKGKALAFKSVSPSTSIGRRRTFSIRGKGIFQRLPAGQTRTLFTFARSVRIDPILRFESTAVSTVRLNFESHFAREFDNAVRTAR